MSLDKLNQPTLVSVCGLAAFGASRFVGTLFASTSLNVVKIVNLSAYGLSLFAVGQPGRLDSGEAQGNQNAKKNDSADEDHSIHDYMAGKSLLAPSGWAFVIWAPIILGEVVFVSSSAAMVNTTSNLAPLFKKVSGSFCLAQIFQVLWTASFRPKYKGKLAYISACMLTGTALSLSQAHSHFSLAKAGMTRSEYILYFLPLSLHFGWTTAASLVNWNGALSAGENMSTAAMVATGHLSAVIATGIGVGLTLAREAPVFGGVIAWALSACATGMNKRIKEKSLSPGVAAEDKSALTGERVQKWLCASGALLSASASAYVAFRPRK